MWLRTCSSSIAFALPLALMLLAPAPAGAQQYLGCFKDNAATRDLNGAPTSHAAMTVNACIAHCARAGYRYAGVQYFEFCFCSNSYGRYGRANNCNTPCGGNPRQTCGGSLANSVYTTSSAGRAPSPRTQPAARGYYARWVKVAGPGRAWATKWTWYGPQFIRAYRQPVCRHGVACRRGGANYCGYWRAGQRVLFWAGGYNRPPWTIVCQVRR